MHLPCARSLGVLALVFACTAPATAGDAPSNDDCKLALKARQVLLRDSVLEPLNLGVRVKRRVATVWGAATDRKVAELALDSVRKVQGVAAVVDHITIENSELKFEIR